MTQAHIMTPETLADTLNFFDSWEEKYSCIIDLGKELPAFPEADKTDTNLVKGCQSLVWITHTQTDERFHFHADSDALIVKGLLAIILITYSDKTAEEILAFDIEAYFQQLDLMTHLSNTRGNGIRAMIARIRSIASPGVVD